MHRRPTGSDLTAFHQKAAVKSRLRQDCTLLRDLTTSLRSLGGGVRWTNPDCNLERRCHSRSGCTCLCRQCSSGICISICRSASTSRSIGIHPAHMPSLFMPRTWRQTHTFDIILFCLQRKNTSLLRPNTTPVFGLTIVCVSPCTGSTPWPEPVGQHRGDCAACGCVERRRGAPAPAARGLGRPREPGQRRRRHAPARY